jgi:hypothetical protein
MTRNGNGWKLLISILIGLAGTASLHFQDGYPWPNCMLLGAVLGFLCFGLLVIAWHK